MHLLKVTRAARQKNSLRGEKLTQRRAFCILENVIECDTHIPTMNQTNVNRSVAMMIFQSSWSSKSSLDYVMFDTVF